MIDKSFLPGAATRILIVDDDHHVAESLNQLLATQGYLVDIAHDTTNAKNMVAERLPGLILLDLAMPGGNGTDLLVQWRSQGLTIPIIVITGETNEAVRLACLEMGADAVVSKPFQSDELLARLALQLRCIDTDHVNITNIGGLRIDSASKAIYHGPHRLTLTARQFELLVLLARRPGRIASRAMLISQIYDGADQPAANVIDVFVHAIRKQLRNSLCNAAIETVRGEGFRLIAAN